MPNFCLNTNQQLNGDYEVHDMSCSYLPAIYNREALGWHSSCHDAVTEAKRRHPAWRRINGCAYCSPACHTH